MKTRSLAAACVLAALSLPAAAAQVPGSADAGRTLVTQSCTTCHTPNATKAASDQAPPLSTLARDNKERPAWIRGWLMDPHPPMPGIMLNRRQIDDIVAYLNTLPNS